MTFNFCVRYGFDLNIAWAVINKRFHKKFSSLDICSSAKFQK